MCAVIGLLAGIAVGFLVCAVQTRGRVEAARADTRNEERKVRDEMLRVVEEKEEKLRDAMEQKMRQEISNLTRTLLEERQREFAASSSESLSRVMEPLQENIRQMKEAVRDNTMRNSEYNGRLKEGIESVLRQSQQAMKSADRLADVLSSSNRVQGDFGERVLTEILESSGLREGIHYETQYTVRDDAGKALRDDDNRMKKPDVVLHLDSGHHVVIDSKVSLTAFYRYMEAETDEERRRCLREHVESVRKQVRNLADKDYSLHLKGAVDYVIMFVPITNALYVATREDPRLWREAMDRKVYIADEQTLFAALKIISLNWRRQAQSENQQKVYQLAGEMLKRVQLFMTKFASVGASLRKAQGEYDEAYRKLGESGQSIPQTCRKLIDLGAPYDRKRKTLLDDMMSSDDEG